MNPNTGSPVTVILAMIVILAMVILLSGCSSQPQSGSTVKQPWELALPQETGIIPHSYPVTILYLFDFSDSALGDAAVNRDRAEYFAVDGQTAASHACPGSYLEYAVMTAGNPSTFYSYTVPAPHRARVDGAGQVGKEIKASMLKLLRHRPDYQGQSPILESLYQLLGRALRLGDHVTIVIMTDCAQYSRSASYGWLHKHGMTEKALKHKVLKDRSPLAFSSNAQPQVVIVLVPDSVERGSVSPTDPNLYVRMTTSVLNGWGVQNVFVTEPRRVGRK